MKTMGVIGGISPQATMYFEQRVHAISQRLIPQLVNSGYPPMVVYFHRTAPFILGADYRPVMPLQPHPELLAAAQKLGTWADFLVITANAPHLMQDLIEQASGLKVLSIIALTLDDMKRRNWQKVGVLGLGEPTVYLKPLRQLGLPCETVSRDLRDRLDRAILALSEGQVGAESQAIAQEAVDELRSRGVDGVILGCTEIPLLLGEGENAPDLINPLQLLAEAAVRHAIEP